MLKSEIAKYRTIYIYIRHIDTKEGGSFFKKKDKKETELPKQVAVKERSTSKEDSLPRWGQLLLTQINYKHVI